MKKRVDDIYGVTLDPDLLQKIFEESDHELEHHGELDEEDFEALDETIKKWK